MPRPVRVVLGKNLARSIRRGHPWVYRDALRPGPPLDDGAMVEVATGDGRPLARGFWDSRSPIAVRLLGDDRADLRRLVTLRVAATLARRRAFIDRAATDAFRWIHGEGDGLPGIHVDLYGRIAVVRFDGAGARAFYGALPETLFDVAEKDGLALTAIVERKRGARKGAGSGGAHGEGEGKAEVTETAVALSGALPSGEIEVRENGLRFGVDVVHGQKGGLFLDQRDNRARVRALSAGRRVLNLFGYTGGFSIYAASGGARETTTVDVARGAIEAARRNYTRNGLPLDGAQLFVEDAFVFLEREARRGARWDLVISDPPSFAPSRKALPRALAAYRRLHRLCAAVVAPEGLLAAASCSSHVDRAAFLRTVEAGADDAGRRWSLTEIHGAAADHPVAPAFPEGDYLKFALGRL